MLKLAFLLIGSRAFKSRWYVLSALGGLLVLAALYLAFLASPDTVILAGKAIGLFFIATGALHLGSFIQRKASPVRTLSRVKCVGLIVLGAGILDWPVDTDFALSLLFSLAFAFDGGGRLLAALFIRLPGWRVRTLCGVAEIAIAVLIITDWPLGHGRNIALCIGLFIALSGWLLVRIGLMFRTLENEAAILNLPLFAERGWYDSAPVLIDTGENVPVEHPMTVHVWTPVGSATVPERRLLLDRYVAAVDANGVISTGHASLEMEPDLYISHYPAVELDRSSTDFVGALRATAENDLKGRFQPSYAYEAEWWCPADAHVAFRNFNPRRLRAFWVGYRQDDTYNLTNRNCSVVVAHALDAALEGALDTRYPWLKLLVLLVNPDIWLAAMLRSRADLGTWTPGLVLDYASTLARIVEKREVAWGDRFRHFLRRLRAGGRENSEVAA